MQEHLFFTEPQLVVVEILWVRTRGKANKNNIMVDVCPS